MKSLPILFLMTLIPLMFKGGQSSNKYFSDPIPNIDAMCCPTATAKSDSIRRLSEKIENRLLKVEKRQAALKRLLVSKK